MTIQRPLGELDRDERMLLLRFVCSFAWADDEVKPDERELIARLCGRLQLEPEERDRVVQWLEAPPPPESVDPALVPEAHHVSFLRAVETVVSVDGEVTETERRRVIRFAQALRARSGVILPD